MNQSPFSLSGRSILVTGASSGIGRACAIMSSQLGAKVIVTGRDMARLDQTFRALQGDGHHILTLDLLDQAACNTFVASVNPIDGLAYCAGSATLSPFRLVSERHLDAMLGINLRAPILLTRALLKAQKINNGASLAYVTAVADHIAPPGSAAYSAAKAGLTAAVRSLALEVARRSIRANCLSPGYVDTPMLTKLAIDTSIESLIDKAPLGIIEPEQVAAGMMYLLSPASRWVSRTALVVDGGITLPVR